MPWDRLGEIERDDENRRRFIRTRVSSISFTRSWIFFSVESCMGIQFLHRSMMDSIPLNLERAHFRTVFLIFVALTQLSGLVEAQSPPSSYDLRAVGSGNSTVAWVPAIQNQGAAEDCWTFASATAMNYVVTKGQRMGHMLDGPDGDLAFASK